MYADTEMMFPYYQNSSQEFQQLEQFCLSQKFNASMDSTILEYDLGGEGDLFKAPEPIIEEAIGTLDPMTATISMLSCGNNVISSEAIRVADIKSTNEQLFSEVFYECKKDLLEKSAIETPSDVFDIKIDQIEERKLLSEVPLKKSVSSNCLSSMEWENGAVMRPNFLDIPSFDFGAVYGMRRVFSEGDIKTRRNGNTSLIHSSLEQPLVISNCTIEERRQKLLRYRNKKAKRNFGRKIKYVCRKALADSQPRIRGRFARTEETGISKKQ